MLQIRNIITQSPLRGVCVNTVRHARKVADPGIRNRKKLLEIDEQEEIEDFDEFESDFSEVHKSHKQYMKEMEQAKEKIKYHMVKQKYFKQKFPNFLTWHDKEQIRHLHRTDPQEWTIERLSEGFPALPEVIKKILKSNWTKNSQEQITSHDVSVQNNWKLFKEGKMSDLSESLVSHLNKFTNRALNLNPFEVPKTKENTVTVKKKVGTEFSDIITSYQKIKHGSSQNENNKSEEVTHLPCLETNKVTSGNRRKPVTLSQLQTKLVEKVELGKEVDVEEKFMVQKLKMEENKKEAKGDLVDLSQTKYQSTTGIQFHKKEAKDLSHLEYPEYIKIPKAVLKKGYIYKLNDCYYDDDGEFLYRVPGMS